MLTPFTHARARIVTALLASVIMVAVPGAPEAGAATLTVTTTNDSGPGSLRQTMADAAPGDTIAFAVTGTILLNSQLVIDKGLTISGPGANQLAISGGGTSRVFEIAEGVAAPILIQRLTIRDGAPFDNWGGAIFVWGPITLTVRDMTFSSNHAVAGGAIMWVGDGLLRIERSTFQGNWADAGGAIYVLNDAIIDVLNSTFTANVTTFCCGGSAIYGDGVDSDGLRISNSTFSGNTTLNPRPGYGNTIHFQGALSVRNTLIVDDSSIASCVTEGYPRVMSGVNLSDDGSCGFTQVSADALQLGPLADNGGPTMTHALLEGSVAIDATNDCMDWFGQAVITDQRGVARPQRLACDVGAFEREANTFTFSGFFAPVDNLPTLNIVKAGSSVPVKFSPGSDKGLNILVAGSPAAPAVPCMPGYPTDSITEVATAGQHGLSYNPVTLVCNFVWKTDKAWANSCREFQLTLTDGTVHKARLIFSK